MYQRQNLSKKCCSGGSQDTMPQKRELQTSSRLEKRPTAKHGRICAWCCLTRQNNYYNCGGSRTCCRSFQITKKKSSWITFRTLTIQFLRSSPRDRWIVARSCQGIAAPTRACERFSSTNFSTTKAAVKSFTTRSCLNTVMTPLPSSARPRSQLRACQISL